MAKNDHVVEKKIYYLINRRLDVKTILEQNLKSVIWHTQNKKKIISRLNIRVFRSGSHFRPSPIRRRPPSPSSDVIRSRRRIGRIEPTRIGRRWIGGDIRFGDGVKRVGGCQSESFFLLASCLHQSWGEKQIFGSFKFLFQHLNFFIVFVGPHWASFIYFVQCNSY